MNKFLQQYRPDTLVEDESISDEYDVLMGADELQKRVTDVKDAIDLLKIPPPPTKEELMTYRKQILKRIRYLEKIAQNLPPGYQRKSIQKQIRKLKGGSKNILKKQSPIFNALFLGGFFTAITPFFAQSHFRRDIESPADLLVGQKLEQWDDDDFTATPSYATLMKRYPAFYALEFLLASGLFYKWIQSGLKNKEKAI